jgi:sugar/nucleoside kinase (ribokinase family)
MLDVVSVGEVMVQFNPLSPGPLRYARLFETHVAGAEANTLVGLTRLGYRCGLITRLGKDEFGMLIYTTLRGEGIDVSRVKFDDEAPTGIYFAQRHYPVPGRSTVIYYRRGSAASLMDEEDIDEDYIASSKSLYLTGITPALSESAARATAKALQVALKNEVVVVFDTNIRMKLWKSVDRARKGLKVYIENAKVLFTNEEDLEVLFPGGGVGDAARRLLEKGKASVVVVKLGARGAFAVERGGRSYSVSAFSVPLVEDVIGAGDAFNAAFLASYYRGLPIEEALTYASAAGALVVTVRGDIEALPTWDALKTFVESQRKTVMLR